VRLRFALAAALPALAALAAMALVGDRLARRALEAELGARLVAVAQAAAAGLPADRVAALQPGDEATRTYGHLAARLTALAAATGTRLVLARPDRTALLDSDGRHRIGEPLAELERDRFELGQVAAGRSVASQVLFEGVDGQLYKSGYAPLADAQGQVVALVAAHGTAPSFASLRDFRNLLLLLAVTGGALGAAAAVVAAVSVTRPLRALAGAARRMGAGDLASPMPAVAGRGEVATLRRTLEETRRALSARDEERETMLAGIAHEVRNPLGAMALYAGALADDLRGRPEAALVARIRSELDGLKRLVEEFLDYARPRPLALEPVAGGSLAEEVRDLCLPVAQARGVALQAGGEGAFEADRHLLRRAALNLVRNALEASPPGGAASLSVRVADGQAVVSVLDRGPGLPPEVRARLFQPFTTTRERGTGLGLALARQAALAHGGTLELLDRDGGGTEARLALPLRPAAGPPRRPAAAPLGKHRLDSP